jgi:ribosomal protein S18 acetylase RimI-like enzyme
MNDIVFKPINEDADIKAVASLADEIWREHYADIISREQIDYMLRSYQSPDSIKEQIQKEDCLYWTMINDEGITVGYVAVQRQKNYLFLSKLYILRTYRRQGYGTQTICKICEIAKKMQYRKIRLSVNKQNSGSLAAYQKLGFKKISDVIKDIGHGFVMDDFILQKTL